MNPDGWGQEGSRAIDGGSNKLYRHGAAMNGSVKENDRTHMASIKGRAKKKGGGGGPRRSSLVVQRAVQQRQEQASSHALGMSCGTAKKYHCG
jgi:hypothetical protein